MPRPTNERGLGSRLLGSLIGAGFALGLALAAAHYYSPPNLNSASPNSPWLEPDFCLASASGLVALGVGLYAGRAFAHGRVLAAVVVRTLLWLLLTMLLVAVWANSIALLTLLIAPSHAFAGLRLATLVRIWRAEQLFRR